MMITSTDPIVGWEAITPSVHPARGTNLLAERLWRARDQIIENGLRAGWFDQDGLEQLAEVASRLEAAEPCGCVLPDQSCVACQLSAHAISILQEMGA